MYRVESAVLLDDIP